jgi:aquaporin Z
MVESLGKRTGAEAIGTFWLVLGGCGSAVLAAQFTPGGIGLLGVALAFGLSVLTMAYAVANVSGAHFNPAVTMGVWAARRFPGRDVLPYIAAQFAGAIAATGMLHAIASGRPGFLLASGFATNGYGAHSPGGYSLGAVIVAEVVLTAGFLVVILGSTHERAPVGFAPLAIGLALALIHLVGIPVSNVSVNPARSTGPALVAGGWALDQLWVFWIAPFVSAILVEIVASMVAAPAHAEPRIEARAKGHG